MAWEPWSRADSRGLARYVTREASLAIGLSRYDVMGQKDERRRVIQAIYDALVQKSIRYALETYHPSEQLQPIRTPGEILEAPREGTCLDLAVLFWNRDWPRVEAELQAALRLEPGHPEAARTLQRLKQKR